VLVSVKFGLDVLWVLDWTIARVIDGVVVVGVDEGVCKGVLDLI
jgi:hypothetical protein